MDWEHIVVDDGSTDHTPYVCNKRFKHVRYIRLPENFGADTRPKNIGAMHARGKYIIFLDDDCELRYDALHSMVAVLDDQPEVDVVYGDMWLQPSRKPGACVDFNKQLMLHRNYIDTSSAMMRREALFYVGGWDETLPRFVDWNIFFRMVKAGFNFQRLPQFTFDYYVHQESKSKRIPVETYYHPELGLLLKPTFDPLTCPIRLPYLKGSGEDLSSDPKVAIFTMHYDRVEYSILTAKSMYETAGYPFKWYAMDQGSSDGTANWLSEQNIEGMTIATNLQNTGLTKGSNDCVDRALADGADIIIKIDNDVEFLTYDWLKDFVELWKQNHSYYMSPYVEGLLHNPGGSPRMGYSVHGKELLEVTPHIGGIFAMISARAYKNFRWQDRFKHGNQDLEASLAFRNQGYMPVYVPKHRIRHRDGTQGQHEKYKDYFKRREIEKVTT